MPPVTPSATRAIGGSGKGRTVGRGSSIRRIDHQRSALLADAIFPGDLLHRPGDDFGLRDRRLLVIADLDARRRSGEELARARARGDHEFERVLKLGAINHGEMSWLSFRL